MDILELREYCLALPLAEETTPFDETTLVYKVAGKMFLLTDMAGDLPEPLIREWILDSYRLVVNSLPRAKRETLLRLLEEDKT